MKQQSSYNYNELLACGHGEVFGFGNAQLPLPPMLMVDRIVRIEEDTGLYGKGQIIAELDINPELWFFDCHFHNDPVMPGCLGLDAMWQLLGFFLGWKGFKGRGRARGGQIKFNGSIFPSAKKVVYELHIKRIVDQRLKMGIADGTLLVDSKKIYEATDLKTVMTLS